MAAASMRPSVTFEVEKIIDVSVGTGNVNNYQVQWAPTWVSGLNLLGCEHLIEEFLLEQDKRLKQIQRQQKQLQQQQQTERQQQQQQQAKQQCGKKKQVTGLTNAVCKWIDSGAKQESSCSKFGSAMQRTELRRLSPGRNVGNSTDSKTDINVSNIRVLSLSKETEKIPNSDNLENDASFNVMKSQIDILQEENFDGAAPSLEEVNCVVDAELSPSDNLDDSEPVCSSSLENSLLEPDKIIVKNEEVMTVDESDSEDENGVGMPLQNTYSNLNCDGRTTGATALSNVLDGQFYESPAVHCYNDENYIENIPYNNEFAGFQIPDIHSSGSGTSGGEEKTYKCDICYKSYSTKNNLNRHQRLHTDPKPYTCQVCEKSFSRNDNMLKHQRLYAFACNQCKTHFTTQESLEQHMLSYHNVII